MDGEKFLAYIKNYIQFLVDGLSKVIIFSTPQSGQRTSFISGPLMKKEIWTGLKLGPNDRLI